MSSALYYIKGFFTVLKLTDIFDMLLIAFLVYQLLKILKETRAMQLVKGVFLLFLVLQLSSWANLNTLNYLLKNAMQVGMFAIVVIFQPELRSLLEKIGRSGMSKLINVATGNTKEEDVSAISEIVTAAGNMSSAKTGGLIVIERETKLGDVIRTGTVLDAEISSMLLENIFFHNSPLHDGAVIIRSNKIHTAGCFLPLTSNSNLSRDLGTRHRAALGISEVSDSVVVVISEETGKISIAINGSLTRNLTEATLKTALTKALIKEADKAVSKEKLKFWRGAK